MQNAEEREDEEDWLKLCFPRFYLYDVLRGLNFILAWAKVRNQQIPAHSIKRVIEAIETQCKNGDVLVGRRSFEGIATRAGGFSLAAGKRTPTSHFTLLDKVSSVGSASSHLTLQWVQAQKSLNELKQCERLS